MGKKKKEKLDKQYGPFSAGHEGPTASPTAAIKALWDMLLPFSDYAFNKAHTAAYGLVSYWTAYLKANYPAEYMAALLTSVKDDKDKSAIYLNECRRMKIQVLPPDVNESPPTSPRSATTSASASPRSATSATNVVDAIVAARERAGPLRRLQRLPRQGAGAGLQQAGDRVADQGRRLRRHEAPPRGRWSRSTRTAVDQYVDIKRNEAIGQDSLFGDLDDDRRGFDIAVSIPDIEEWDKTTLLGYERDMLGLYVSDHPLLGLEHVLLAKSTDCTIGQLMLDEERADGSTVTVSGLVTSVQRKITKRGDAWAMITLEDLDGAIDVLLFPSTYQLASTLLVEDAILTVKGRSRGQGPARAHGPGGQRPRPLRRPERAGRDQPAVDPLHRPVVAQLKDVLGTHPGVTEVRLRLLTRDATKVMRLDDRLRVTPSPALFADLKQLLGPGCLTG